MIKITIESMQGNASGNKCLKVSKEDGTRYGTTLGFIIPIQYNLQGYWGGVTYLTFSFCSTTTEKSCQTLHDVAEHLGISDEELVNALPFRKGEPYYRQWDYINTDFTKDKGI